MRVFSRRIILQWWLACLSRILRRSWKNFCTSSWRWNIPRTKFIFTFITRYKCLFYFTHCVGRTSCTRNTLYNEYVFNAKRFQAEYHAKQLDGFIEAHGKEYKSVKVIRHDENVKEWHARNLGMWENQFFMLTAGTIFLNPWLTLQWRVPEEEMRILLQSGQRGSHWQSPPTQATDRAESTSSSTNDDSPVSSMVQLLGFIDYRRFLRPFHRLYGNRPGTAKVCNSFTTCLAHQKATNRSSSSRVHSPCQNQNEKKRRECRANTIPTTTRTTFVV